jgi:hypothetical protein
MVERELSPEQKNSAIDITVHLENLEGGLLGSPTSGFLYIIETTEDILSLEISGPAYSLKFFFLGLQHKVLTYVEYRAVSDVFQNIDPPPPLRLASVSSPRTKGGGYTLAGRRGGGGSIFWKTPAIGLASYSNLSTDYSNLRTPI